MIYESYKCNVMIHKTVYMNNVYNLIWLGNMIIYDFKVKIFFVRLQRTTNIIEVFSTACCITSDQIHVRLTISNTINFGIKAAYTVSGSTIARFPTELTCSLTTK